jgi:SAM-dependent methyltransferase
MRLSRKIQKLFSREALESLWEHGGRSLHPVSARRILATIDREKMQRLREQYPYREKSPRINRFEDADYWVAVNVERAQDLWLDRSAPLRILDLGCGAGFFLYVCKLFGHDVLGLDTDSEPLFRATTDMLQVRRLIWRIEAGVPLPDLPQRFDLVAAHRICFNRIRGEDPDTRRDWTPGEWKFFLDDVRSRILAPTGRLLLDFNLRRDTQTFFTPELRDFFAEQGARIFRSKALFSAEAKRRPKFRQIGNDRGRG